MKQHRVDTVFFDAAGTLFGVRGSVGEIYGRYAEQFGFHNGGDQSVQQQIEKSFVSALRETQPLAFPGKLGDSVEALEKQWWQGLVRDTFSSLGSFPRIEEFFETVYEVFRTSEAWQLEGHCQEVLAELREKKMKLGVISNFDSRLFDLLREFEIEDCFEAVIISSHAPAAKPSPLIFQYALRKMNSQPDTSIHVGDSIRGDYEAAQSAGLLALLYDPEDRYSDRPNERRIRSLADVSSFLV
ncbi:MAG: HAD-IA family hydrolase [Acidobacteria bacterium]|nr:HAD-IA family hydrolase [Acidobacteriota bacterium]